MPTGNPQKEDLCTFENIRDTLLPEIAIYFFTIGLSMISILLGSKLLSSASAEYANLNSNLITHDSFSRGFMPASALCSIATGLVKLARFAAKKYYEQEPPVLDESQPQPSFLLILFHLLSIPFANASTFAIFKLQNPKVVGFSSVLGLGILVPALIITLYAGKTIFNCVQSLSEEEKSAKNLGAPTIDLTRHRSITRPMQPTVQMRNPSANSEQPDEINPDSYVVPIDEAPPPQEGAACS